MKLLEEVAKQFENSKPVFVASTQYDDTYVEFRLKDPYRPDKSKLEDPIAKLLAEYFQEHLKLSENRFVQSTPMSAVYLQVVKSIEKFYEDHAPLKNPRQSKLYKWIGSMDNRYNHPTAEGFIGLYRYINGGHNSSDDITNVLTILEMMREKYEGKQ